MPQSPDPDQMLSIIADVEAAFADPETAKRKGYWDNARNRVMAFMKENRQLHLQKMKDGKL